MASGADGDRARDIIRGITEDPEIGRVYQGIVRRCCSAPSSRSRRQGRAGPHLRVEPKRVERVDVINEGDTVLVKVIGIDREGEDQASRKQALPGYVPSEDDGASDRGAHGRRSGGGGEDAGRPPAAAGAVAALTGSRASSQRIRDEASASVAVSGAMGERA